MNRDLQSCMAILQQEWARELGIDPNNVLLTFIPQSGVQLVRCGYGGRIVDYCHAFMTPSELEQRIASIRERRTMA